MTKEIAVLEKKEKFNEDLAESFDFDKLEENLQGQLEEELADIRFLEEEKEKIGNPDSLGTVIMDVVWQQFLNQVAVTAGEDFIKENGELKLDLRKEAHIQTAENFAEGKIATHNYISKNALEMNYNRYKNKSHKDFRKDYVNTNMDATLKRAGDLKKQGIETVTDIYTGRQISTETKLENGKHNPKGAQREHVKPSAELYKDTSLQMAYSDEDLAGIINHPDNLQGYTTQERNNRKSNYSADEMSAQDKTKHWQKANKKAEEYIEKKEKEGQNRLQEEGLKTRKEEAFRIGGKALRVVLMQMLAELVKEIIAKLVKWFKCAKRTLSTLMDSLKEAILSFIANMKKHLINAGNTMLTTIATAIIGPVVGVIKKVWILLKQSWSSIKSAVSYLKEPSSRNKPLGIRLMETGKIIIAGLTGAGALILGEVIEKGLMTIPVFAIQIPLFGSLASILGILFGAVVAGIIGAIAINLIEKRIEKNMKEENINAQIEKGNEILNLQNQVQVVSKAKLENTKDTVTHNVHERHVAAANIMIDSLNNIRENCAEDKKIQDKFKNIDKLLEKLEN